jgi:hypothetical protein
MYHRSLLVLIMRAPLAMAWTTTFVALVILGTIAEKGQKFGNQSMCATTPDNAVISARTAPRQDFSTA